MFCGRCGSELATNGRFCSACGAPVTTGAEQAAAGWQATGQAGWAAPASAYGQPAQGPDMLTRLERPRAQRMVAGVCAGLAQHYRWDLTWVRVLTVLITVFSSGAGLVAYIVFWLVMPEQAWMLPTSTASAGPAPPAPPQGL